MKDRIKAFKNGYATIGRNEFNGLYFVYCRIGTELHDKMICGDRKTAFEYYRAFQAIARNA